MTPESIAKMGAEERRIRIAEACGWTKCRLVIKGPGGGTRIPTAHGVPPKRNYEAPCPDFIRSLDAMALAEATLTNRQMAEYWDTLHAMIVGSAFWSDDTSEYHCCSVALASASQRAEAFLRVVGEGK